MYLLLFTSHYKVLEFLFSEALEDEKKFERVCVALQDFGKRVFNKLHVDWRKTILQKLKYFGLVDLYDIYSGIKMAPTVNPPM